MKYCPKCGYNLEKELSERDELHQKMRTVYQKYQARIEQKRFAIATIVVFVVLIVVCFVV